MTALVAKFEAYYGGIGEVMRSEQVREPMRSKARDIAAKTRRAAAAEGIDTNVTVEESTRPKGKRPEAQVRATVDVDAGESRARLLAILRDAGRV